MSTFRTPRKKPLSARCEALLLAIVANQRRARGLSSPRGTPNSADLPDILSDKVAYWNSYHVLVDRELISPGGFPTQLATRHLRSRGLL